MATWQERLSSARAHREAASAGGDEKVVASANGRWAANFEMVSSSVHRATIRDEHQRSLKFDEVIGLWAADGPFAEFYSKVLSASPFESFFFEAPPISKATVAREYEHVTVRAHRFAKASPEDFSEHLNRCSAGATSFTNLGGDATLVAPCNRGEMWHYGHIAAFTRAAAMAQQVELWRTVGLTLQQTLERRGASLTWLSTEGSGVPWLHVRMDSSPKYYHYDAYRRG